MLSFYEFACLIEAQKNTGENVQEASLADVMAKLRAQQGQAQPVAPEAPSMADAGTAGGESIADKLARLKAAQGGLAGKVAAQSGAKPAAAPAAAPAPEAPAAGPKPDVNDPRRKHYKVGVNRPHGEKNVSNQMSPVATDDKKVARTMMKMDDIAEFNSILMAGDKDSGAEKFRHYAREALQQMGIQAPEGPFQIVPSASGRPGEVVVPDIKAIKKIISATWTAISPDYDVEGNRLEKEQMPERMADFHAKLTSGLYNGYNAAEVQRAYQFLKAFKDEGLWGKTMTIDQLAGLLGQLPNKGGLQVPTPQENRRALDLMIKSDMAGKYHVFDIKGDPKDGKSQIAVNGFPGMAEGDEDLHEPVAANPHGKTVDPGVSMSELPGRSNKRAFTTQLPEEPSDTDKLRLALGLGPDQKRRAEPKRENNENFEDSWMSLFEMSKSH